MELDARGIAVVALGALALIQTVALAWRTTARRWTLARRARRARRGELDAEAILAREGFRVVGRQVRGAVTYRIDGAPREAGVVVDLLVERDGRRWVAEVKTGAEAPDPLARPTRRQLLEYAHAFDGAGVLLVDAEAGLVRAFEAPDRGRTAPRARWVWALAGVAVGWAATVLLGGP